jgi:hypothetical protein
MTFNPAGVATPDSRKDMPIVDSGKPEPSMHGSISLGRYFQRTFQSVKVSIFKHQRTFAFAFSLDVANDYLCSAIFLHN